MTGLLTPATEAEIDFLVEAIVSAERLPNDNVRTMYEVIYGISREELAEFLRVALRSDHVGSPLSLMAFRLIFENGLPIACCAGWMEASTGVPSGSLVAMLLSRFLGAKRLRTRSEEIRLLASVAPKRSPHTLQLESFYVTPDWRGRGYTRRLIEGYFAEYSERASRALSAEISLLLENTAARRAYTAAGFDEQWSTEICPPRFRELTGSNGFCQLRRTLFTFNETAS